MRLPPGPGVPFFVGIALAAVVAQLLGPPWSATAVVSILLASACIVLARTPCSSCGSAPSNTPAGLGRTYLLATLAGLVCGGVACSAPSGRVSLGLPIEAVRSFTGVALADSASLEGGRRSHRIALLAVEAAGGDDVAPGFGTVRVLASGGPPTYAGQATSVRGRLERASRPGREAFVARVGGSELRAGGFGSAVLEIRAGVREGLEERVRQMGYPVSGFFLAMFMGDREDVPDELAGLFRDAGALHVLALSGAHLMMIYGLAAFIARLIPSGRVRRTVPLVIVGVYLFFAGPLPSLLRAAAMLAVVRCIGRLGREASGLETLTLAGSILLLLEPRMLFDLSFQLSFCAVAGMVTAGSAVADRLARFAPRLLAVPLSAAIGAQAAVSPILLAVYGVFQPIGLVSGLIVAPLAMALLAAGLADLALPLFLPRIVHAALGSALYAAYRALEACLGFFARFPPSRSWALAMLLWVPPAAAIVPGLLRTRLRPA